MAGEPPKDAPPPPSPPPGAPDGGAPPPGPGGPYHEPSKPSDRNWGVVSAAAALGFIVWVIITTVVVLETMAVEGATGASAPNFALFLIPIPLAAVALIVWPRTRRLGQGFLLGLAIGLVVGGGICIPMVVGAS